MQTSSLVAAGGGGGPGVTFHVVYPRYATEEIREWGHAEKHTFPAEV